MRLAEVSLVDHELRRDSLHSLHFYESVLGYLKNLNLVGVADHGLFNDCSRHSKEQDIHLPRGLRAEG